MAYITKDKSGLVQLWNNKPIYNYQTGVWYAWIVEGKENEVGIDVTANEDFRKISFYESPYKIRI